ncbi:MAG: urocanate hydratase [Bifidobacteriaceae bacterium]|jgi:urocanate hydratase|nr:urocanate hydratase [Bifidobacteriaceae bacterium]
MSQASFLLAGPGGPYQAGRGPTLRARNWRAEGLLRMFENVLEVGENPDELIVYASLGKAARSWPAAALIARALLDLGEDETLVLQSGQAVGVIKTGTHAPAVMSAVNNTVGRWSTPERFYERAAKGQTMWGGLTAGAWQYIGRQGVLQGTYELLGTVARRHFGATPGLESQALAGRWLLTSGLGGMGSSQPISARMADLASIVVEADGAKAGRAERARIVDLVTDNLDQALTALFQGLDAGGAAPQIALVANAADVFAAVASRANGLARLPSIVTDQTAAHDARYGYLPQGYSFARWLRERETNPERVERDARASIAEQVQAMLELAQAGCVVFENGNNLRVQAAAHPGGPAAESIWRIPGFMEGYLRPLFARGIGPFRWVCLSGALEDLARMDRLAASLFPRRPEVARWLALAQQHVPIQGLPARSCWLGHGERSALARAANSLVGTGELTAPVAFTRDHLDAAGMTHPRIGTEGMRDGSDGVADFPLLDAMALSATGADLVAIHSGGGGYSGWMQSAGMTIIADGRDDTAERLGRCLDADTGLGVLRHAAAGYPESHLSIQRGGETGQTSTVFLCPDRHLEEQPCAN